MVAPDVPLQSIFSRFIDGSSLICLVGTINPSGTTRNSPISTGAMEILLGHLNAEDVALASEKSG